jgi:hypothetical protein
MQHASTNHFLFSSLKLSYSCVSNFGMEPPGDPYDQNVTKLLVCDIVTFHAPQLGSIPNLLALVHVSLTET